MSRPVARGIPMSLGARITVRHIKLVARLAGLLIDKAAQTIEIRFRHAEKRRCVLHSGPDQADKPGVWIVPRRDDGVGPSARMSGWPWRRCLGAGGQRQSERGGQNTATMMRHRAGSTISGLSSPRRGASFAEGRPAAPAGIAASRVLDLDHLGPKLAEDHPGIGSRDAVADLDDNDAGKRTDARHRRVAPSEGITRGPYHHGSPRGSGLLEMWR